MFRFRPQIKSLIVVLSIGVFAQGTSAFSLFSKDWVQLSPARFLEQRIDERQGLAQDYAQNKYFQDNKVVVAPFSHTFEAYQKKKNWPLINALNQTRAAFQSKYSCNISLPDLSIILQEADENFRAFFYEDFLYKGKKVSVPTSNKFETVCQKLSQCFLKENQLNRFSFEKCQNKVLEIYQPLYHAAQSQNTVETASLWANIYVNGMLNDSEFDLLYDISQIGKVFFEGFRGAPELVYYQMPLFNKPDESPKSSKTPSTQQTPSSNSRWTSSPTWTSSPSDEQSWRAKNWLEFQDSPLLSDDLPITDAELDAFIHKKQSQTAFGNDEHLLFQNQCILPELTKTVEKKDEKSDFSKIFDPFDHIDQQENTLAYQQQSLATILNTTPPQEKLSDETRRDLQEHLYDLDLDTTSESAKSCVQKCEARDKTGDYHYSFDERLICTMQCLCKERSSPALPNAWFPMLEKEALKIRFCTIPAQIENPDTSSQNVYAIGEIMNGIRKTVAALYGGWRLSVQKIPQEALDSKHIDDHSFAKTAFFTVSTSTKENPKLINPSEQKQHNELFYQNLRAWSLPQDRNTFVLLGKEQNNTPTSSNPKNTSTPDQKTQAAQEQTQTFNAVLKSQHSANMYLGFLEWITQNQSFLQAMQEQLSFATKSLEALNSKR